MNCIEQTIGNYQFTIYTYLDHLNFPFEAESILPEQTLISITIIMDELEKGKEKWMELTENGWKRSIPEDIAIFYQTYNQVLQKNEMVSKHINQYYQKGKETFAYFPYSTDQFFLHYSQDTSIVHLYGKEESVYRIIFDFLTIKAPLLPLHASGVGVGEKAGILVSESGCGKTSILIKLLQNKACFLADDSVFTNEKKVFRVSDQLSIRKEFPNDPKIKQIIQSHKEDKVGINIKKEASYLGFSLSHSAYEKQNFFILQKEERKWKGIKQAIEPFPCLNHHSFWCMNYVVKDHKKAWVTRLLQDSCGFWEEKLKQGYPIYVDFNHLDQTRQEIENILTKGDYHEKIVGD